MAVCTTAFRVTRYARVLVMNNDQATEFDNFDEFLAKEIGDETKYRFSFIGIKEVRDTQWLSLRLFYPLRKGIFFSHA